MKRILTTLTVMIASAMMLTACTKCSQAPTETPAVVEPPQGAPPPVEGAPGDVSAAPAVEETAPAK